MKNLYLIVFLISCIYMNVSAQESKKEAKERAKEEQYQQVMALINTQHYSFRAKKANPQKGRQIDLTTRGNSLVIDQDKAAADLPYFGRALSGGYSSSDGGIKFNGVMETYEVTKNDKKRKVIIKWSIKGTGDNYKCTLSVASLSNATLSVISNKKQTISYTGAISEIQKEEKM